MPECVKLLPLDAEIGDIMTFEEEGDIGYWKADGFAKWFADFENSGRYDIYMLASCGERQGGIGKISVCGAEYEFNVYETGSFSSYHYICCKNVWIDGGAQEIKIMPVKLKQLFFMDLRKVLIIPAGNEFKCNVLKADICREKLCVSDSVLDAYKGKARKELYRYRLDRMLDEYDRAGGKMVTWPGGLWHGLAVLWHKTGEKKYLDRILAKVGRWIAVFERTGKLPQYNFPSKTGITKLLDIAIKSGVLGGTEKRTAEKMIRTLIFNSVYEGGGVMNRNIGYCLGIIAAEEYIKNELEYALLKEMTDNLEAELRTKCEPLENSANYEDITLVYMINYIEKRGMQELYLTEGMRNTFLGLKDKLTPECGLPSYGDYGGGVKYSALLAAVYEAAAGIYKNGEFAYAAERTIEEIDAFRTDAAEELELNGWTFLGLAHAYEWCDENVVPQVRTPKSRLLYRNDGQLDKAVFSGGGLYMMMDFINGCEHGCNNALAVMSITKDGKTVMFDMGHRDEANHCKPLVRLCDENFPKVLKPTEKWETGVIRLADYWSWGVFNNPDKRYHYSLRNGQNDFMFAGCSADYEPESEFMLALFDWRRFQLPYRREESRGTVYIKNLRLVRSDGSEKILSADNICHGDCTVDGGVIKINADADKSAVFAAIVFDMRLDISAGTYEYLKFEIKTEKIRVKDLLITLGDNTYYPHNYPMFLNPMNKVKKLYFNENEYGVAAGFEFDTPVARCVRETAFVSGKGIRIRDTITVKHPDGLTVGTAWRFNSLERLTNNRFLVGDEGKMYASFLTEPTVAEDGICAHERKEEFNKYVVYEKERGVGEYVFDVLLHFDEAAFDRKKSILGDIRVEHDDCGFIIIKQSEADIDEA